MSKVKFPFEVKYKDKYYTANLPFEVDIKDIEELISLGGTVVQQNSSESITQSKNRNRANNHKLKRGINNDST